MLCTGSAVASYTEESDNSDRYRRPRTPARPVSAPAYACFNFTLARYYSRLISKYDYIIVCTNSQLGWLNLPHLLILPPPVTVKHRVVIIPGDGREKGIDGYGEKDFQKRKVV